MKHLFLAAIATGLIFATSCKKEEEPMQQTDSTWKTSDWILVKSGVNIQGTSCDLYKNVKTGQEVYEAKENSRVNYTLSVYTNSLGDVDCGSSGSRCAEVELDGDRVLIIKENK